MNSSEILQRDDLLRALTETLREENSVELLKEQNERERLAQEREKLALAEQEVSEERRRNDLLDESLRFLRNLREDHHDPIMILLHDVSTKLVLLSEVLRYLLPSIFKDSAMTEDAYLEMNRMFEALIERQSININNHTAGRDIDTKVAGDMVGGMKQ